MLKFKKGKRSSVVARPKQVHPRAAKVHGLLGLPYVRQHMMNDERWSTGDITEQFQRMSEFHEKRMMFMTHENRWYMDHCSKEYRNLKSQCRKGRYKLRFKIQDENGNEIHNYLSKHKDLQRLYRNMPLHLVVENMNQRSFCMKKERDRLANKLACLQEKYHDQLINKANLENRVIYSKAFELDEERKSRYYLKVLENAHIRLMATKCINETYSKMLRVLRNDEIFYDPIIRSLNKDLEDQSLFIKYVLYRGIPLQSKFRDLGEEYRQMEDKLRKSMQSKLVYVSDYRKEVIKRISEAAAARVTKPPTIRDIRKRYVRDTDSMKFLRNELEAIESTIKHVKFATLCSQAREIFPRMGAQIIHNQLLIKTIGNGKLRHHSLKIRQKRAEVLQGMLVNNLSEDEILRAETIKILQEDIAREDEFEEKTREQLKERGKLFVLLTLSLWNLNEILRHIGRVPKITRFEYPNSYLKLPLLKFEMLNMHSCRPDFYETNIASILHLVKYKVHLLMHAYKEQTPNNIKECRDEYQAHFLESMDLDEMGDVETRNKVVMAVTEEPEVRISQGVPDRTVIKMRSAKLVEENLRKDD